MISITTAMIAIGKIFDEIGEGIRIKINVLVLLKK